MGTTLTVSFHFSVVCGLWALLIKREEKPGSQYSAGLLLALPKHCQGDGWSADLPARLLLVWVAVGQIGEWAGAADNSAERLSSKRSNVLFLALCRGFFFSLIF